jgi:flagellar biosynthesis protein FlhF
LGVAIQNRLSIAYTTDGQDIPKNLDVARAHQLVSKAVALLKSNPTTAVS